MTLDWAYEEDRHQLTIDQYEGLKVYYHHKLSSYTRSALLQEKSFTTAQLRKATREVAKMQVRRTAMRAVSPFFKPVSDVAGHQTQRVVVVSSTKSSRKNEQVS